jgi:hypothetical protein
VGNLEGQCHNDLHAAATWLQEGSITLCHAGYGGVIQGSWSFWGSEPLQVPECPLVEGRTLFHVIDSSSKVSEFVPCPPLDFAPQGKTVQWIETFREVCFVNNDQSIVDGRGLLLSEGVLDAVQCPFVYSRTKWAVRRLTVKELLSVFDLTGSLKTVFRSGAGCPFLSSSPGRLLGALLGTISHAAKPYDRHVPLSFNEPVDFGAQLSVEVSQWPDQTGVEWRGVSESTTKSNDAQAHTRLWDQRILRGVHYDEENAAHYEDRFGVSCLDTLRGWLLSRWRRLICQSLLKYLAEIRDSAVPRDREVGRDALHKAAQATWWEWPGGSTPFFWRWPSYALEVVQDGNPPWFCSEPPRYVKPQRKEKDEDIHNLMVAKLRSIQAKNYIAKGKVISLTSYFAMLKGTEDI